MPMNFAALFRAFDAAVALRDATRRFRGDPPAAPPEAGLTTTSGAGSALVGQIETRLTNVVVAALKEAFDRDHARLELEREHLQEQRRRAEETTRMELLRQITDRELSRLKLLVVAGLVGWVGSVLLLLTRLHEASAASRGTLIAASVLSLGALGSAFTAQAHLGVSALEHDPQLKTGASVVSLSLLLAGLALAAISLVL